MTNQLEALKIAIETMEHAGHLAFSVAISACKEALAEAEKQEPAKQKVKILYEKNGIQTCEILPTATWQSLSDDEIFELSIREFTKYEFARAIEQALRERNCNDTK